MRSTKFRLRLSKFGKSILSLYASQTQKLGSHLCLLPPTFNSEKEFLLLCISKQEKNKKS